MRQRRRIIIPLLIVVVVAAAAWWRWPRPSARNGRDPGLRHDRGDSS
jgi:hypothetical protein